MAENLTFLDSSSDGGDAGILDLDNGTAAAVTDTLDDYDYEDYEYNYDDSITSYDWTELGPSIFVYSVTFLAGVVGNILILLAVIRHTHVKNSPVNVFLASLASADLLLILICLPLKVRKERARDLCID